MSTTHSPKVSSYRRHKQSGQAVVTLPDGLGSRRDVLLGQYGTPESHAEYARVIAEWQAARGRVPARLITFRDLTVNEVLVRFFDFADRHYRHSDGTPTGEAEEFRYSVHQFRYILPGPRCARNPLRAAFPLTDQPLPCARRRCHSREASAPR